MESPGLTSVDLKRYSPARMAARTLVTERG